MEQIKKPVVFNSGHLDICSECGADMSKPFKSMHDSQDMRCNGNCQKFAPIVNSYEKAVRTRKNDEIIKRKAHPIRDFLTRKDVIGVGISLVGFVFAIVNFNKKTKTKPNNVDLFI